MGGFTPKLGARLRLNLNRLIAAVIVCAPAPLFAAQHVPPSFVAQPASVAVPAGQSATFFVVASGSPTLDYQWRFNGTDIPGATDTNLVVISAGSSNAGIYSVQVTNSYGVTNSADATLIANYPPVILTHPVSQGALLGSNVAFQVTATGTPAFGYRWQFNGVPVPGGTNATLTISAVQSNNVGGYTAVVTNAGGATTSLVATLSIVTSPDFLWARSVTNGIPPNFAADSYGQDVAADASGNVYIVGVGEGPDPIDFGGVMITNTSNNSSFFARYFIAKYDRWGDFLWAQLAVTNSWTSGPPRFRVRTDSSGNCYLAGRFQGTAAFGTNVLLSESPTDLFVAKYDPQGHALWATRVGACDPFYYYPPGLAVDALGNVILAGRYTNSADFGSVSVTNSPAFLAKYDSSGKLAWAKPSLEADAIACDPSGSILLIGAASPYFTTPGFLAKYDDLGTLLWSRTFPHSQAMAVDASGNIYTTGIAAGTYDGITITNVGGGSTFFLATCDPAGQLTWVRQVASVTQQMGTGVSVDSLGSVYVTSTSASAARDALVVIGPSVLTNVCSFLAKFDPAGNALWGKDIGGFYGGQARGIALCDSQQIYITGTFYYHGVLGNFNLWDSNPMAPGDLYVAKLAGIESAAPPQITVQPQGLNLPIGSDASFNVGALGAFPLAYQWFFNGTNVVAGATNSTFTITNAQLANAGSYSAIVTNTYGSATSAVVMLTVHPPPPQIITQPQSLSVTIGANAALTVAASGDAPLAYQWFFNATNAVSGATSSTFTVTNAQMSNSGNYSVIVTNAYGSVTSAVAALTVYPADGGTLSSLSVNRTNHQVRFNVAGIAGLKYAVQASSNLSNWISISTNTSPFLFTDPSAGNFARRYYRSIYIQ